MKKAQDRSLPEILTQAATAGPLGRPSTDLLGRLRTLDAPDLIAWALDAFPARDVVFTTSLGAEDQVILDMLARQLGPSPASAVVPRVATLDTGRLHQETYDVLAANRRHYPAVPIQVLFPRADSVEAMVAAHGIDLYRTSRDLRIQCCAVRKVEPLGRALADARLWISGLRRDQAPTRTALDVLSLDSQRGIWKLSPLWNWTSDRVAAWLDRCHVPRNALHALGYPSIGCAPCTRAVVPGEDERAGRWWWEDPDHKECGLHRVTQPGARSTVQSPVNPSAAQAQSAADPGARRGEGHAVVSRGGSRAEGVADDAERQKRGGDLPPSPPLPRPSPLPALRFPTLGTRAPAGTNAPQGADHGPS